MTNGENFNTAHRPKKVLLAPLDWGLGHATRCIPIIKELFAQGCDVLIAAEGATEALLKKEFPALTFLSLQGYNITYSRSKFWLPLKMLLQFPKLLSVIYKEQNWLKKTAEQHKIDMIITDNRMGFYHSTIPSVYITHQLTIKTANRFTEWLAQKIHYRYINKFTECWVPDAEGNNNLAGELSHAKKLPHTAIKYLGALSRFEKMEAEKMYDLLVIISGPEPQRTIFEELLLNQLKNFNDKVLFVRGLPGNAEIKEFSNPLIEIQNHLSAAELNKAILQSNLVISRSGYTTVMDLNKLQQKAILVATPGQTEQEYLAEYLMDKKMFYSVNQKQFLLNEAVAKSNSFPFIFSIENKTSYKEIIKDFIKNNL